MNDPFDAPATDDGAVTLCVDGHVAHVVFDRPAARNALTWSMYEALADACSAIDADPQVRVAVFRGAGGKAFVAGTDIEQFTRFRTGADGVAYEEKFASYIARVGALRVPSVAVVERLAVGGGLAIATLCDFRVATPGARFGVPIARTLGNCLSAGNLRVLIAALGEPIVKRMLLLAELIPAEELLAGGYVLKVVDETVLDETVAQLADQIAGLAPVTLSVTRTLLSRLATGSDEPDEALIEACYGSADFAEGVAAFVAKRAPQWRGS